MVPKKEYGARLKTITSAAWLGDVQALHSADQSPDVRPPVFVFGLES